MDNKPYDSAFKDFADQDSEALLRLIGALPPDATVRPLRAEISAPALAADQPYEVITAADHYIAHRCWDGLKTRPGNARSPCISYQWEACDTIGKA